MIVVQTWLLVRAWNSGDSVMKSKQRNALAIDANMTPSSLCVETQQDDRQAGMISHVRLSGQNMRKALVAE